MDFQTIVQTNLLHPQLNHNDSILSLGSCFSENLGEILLTNKFDILINPFGTLYNPSSISSSLHHLIHNRRYTSNDLFFHEGCYHCFDYHSRYSSIQKEECLSCINEQSFKAKEQLKKCHFLIITWGTAFVYRLNSNGEIVSNCHKLPAKLFTRKRLTINEIVADYSKLLLELKTINPSINILFTVSPIRHWKDGAHENLLSKSILLLAIDQIQKEQSDFVSYFPAYEIVMDELRDYRFYAEDMIHPSETAINYIWERFSNSCISKESLQFIQTYAEIRKAMGHHPFHSESPVHQNFLNQCLDKIEKLAQQYPTIDFQKEKDYISAQIIV